MSTGDENKVMFGPELTIDTLSKPNSVWFFFGNLRRSGIIIDMNHKYCNECLKIGKIFRYGLRTANGNHRHHLNLVHKIELSSAVTEKNQRKVSDMLSNPSSSLETTPKNDKRLLLARQMSLWFCRDLEPFNTANKDGLADFSIWAGIIKRDENFPDRNTLSHAALDDIYSVVYKNVLQMLIDSLPDVIPISFDFWTDNAKRMSYLSYWITWVDSDFNMKKVCLRTFSFPHPHNFDVIATSFMELKKEFRLENKKFYPTTDSGSNIKKACKHLNLPREACLAHNMHLLVTDDLLKHPSMQKVRDLICQMKRIMKTLMYKYQQLKKIHDEEYNKRLYEIFLNLEEISELLDVEEFEISDFDIEEEDIEMVQTFLNEKSRKNSEYKTLKNSNATRWNSVLSMMRSFVRNIDVINRCLELGKKYDDILSDTDLSICKDVVKVLEVFEKATDLLQGDYPTLNLALITYVDIKKHLRELRSGKCFSALTKEAVNILLENFSYRFPISKNMVLAAYMDPSLSQLPAIQEFLDSEDLSMFDLIQDKCQEFGISIPPSTPVEAAPKKSRSSSTSAKRLRLELIEKHSNVATSNSFHDCLADEIRQFNSNNEVVEDALDWWKHHKKEFPILAQLARVTFSLMATSSITERHFSKCGVLITKRKSRLDPTNFQRIIFIHENFHLYT